MCLSNILINISSVISTFDEVEISGFVYLESLINIILLILNLLSVTGIGGIIFLSNTISKNIAEKQSEALFGYYSKMIIYLKLLKRDLQREDNTPLYYLLASNANVNSTNKSNEILKSNLLKSVDDFMNLLKSAEWQFPVNKEFSNCFSDLFEMLLLISELDQYHDFQNEREVVNFYQRVEGAIDLTISLIEECQNDIINKCQRRFKRNKPRRK